MGMTPDAKEYASSEQMSSFQARKVSDLIGLPVHNRLDEDLGNIEDIALDVQQGDVAFALISLDGEAVKLSNKQAVVPWSSLLIQPKQDVANVNVDSKTIRQVAYSTDDIPNLNDTQESQEIYAQFDREPYWTVYGYMAPSLPQNIQQMQKDQEAWKISSEYGQKFKSGKQVSFSGKVTSKGSFKPLKDSKATGQRLRVQTEDGKFHVVHLAPESYLQKQNLSLSNGDQVMITGHQSKIDGRDVVIATKIKAQDQTIELRNSEGEPQWSSSMSGRSKWSPQQSE
jgi:sporulation protein YlmC with PRC-barrel domain